MIVFLDANIIIYLVENHPDWGPKVLARIAQFRTAGDEIAIGDASRMECLVGPFMIDDQQLLADYAAFFQSPDFTVMPLTAAVCQRAAFVRATENIKPLDALHLATAIIHGCGLFLTNDVQLRKCTQITVEILT